MQLANKKTFAKWDTFTDNFAIQIAERKRNLANRYTPAITFQVLCLFAHCNNKSTNKQNK